MGGRISAAGWKAAEEHADRVAPMPKTSSALGAAMGLFGGGVLAMLTLIVAGVQPDMFPGSMALGVISVGCALSCYLYFRSHEQAHYRAFAKEAERIEGEERRQEQGSILT